MTLEEFRAGQKRRVFAVSRNYGITGVVLGTLLAVQNFLAMLESSIKSVGLGRRRMSPMTLGEFRGSHRRRLYAVARSTGLVGLVLLTLFVLSAGIAGKAAVAKESRSKPAMQQMQAQMQDMMVMMQNSAVWTAQGLFVLQGNRILHYSADMQLQHTITLPIPQASTTASAAMPMSGSMPGSMAMGTLPSMRSRVAARLLPAANGLIVIRGRQIIWLDGNYEVAGKATLPELPPLTPDELAAVCPMDPPMMPGGGMMMGATGIPGMSGMPIQGAAAAQAGHFLPQR